MKCIANFRVDVMYTPSFTLPTKGKILKVVALNPGDIEIFIETDPEISFLEYEPDKAPSPYVETDLYRIYLTGEYIPKEFKFESVVENSKNKFLYKLVR